MYFKGTGEMHKSKVWNGERKYGERGLATQPFSLKEKKTLKKHIQNKHRIRDNNKVIGQWWKEQQQQAEMTGKTGDKDRAKPRSKDEMSKSQLLKDQLRSITVCISSPVLGHWQESKLSF